MSGESDLGILLCTFIVWLFYAIQLLSIPINVPASSSAYAVQTELTESKNWCTEDDTCESSLLLSPIRKHKQIP